MGLGNLLLFHLQIHNTWYRLRSMSSGRYLILAVGKQCKSSVWLSTLFHS